MNEAGASRLKRTLTGFAYRAHHPRWSFAPASGEGAARHGGRFNPVGMAALYTARRMETAWLEAQQAFPFKAQPLTLCAYEVDCADVVDLTDPKPARPCRSAWRPSPVLGRVWHRLGRGHLVGISPDAYRPRAWPLSSFQALHPGLRRSIATWSSGNGPRGRPTRFASSTTRRVCRATTVPGDPSRARRSFSAFPICCWLASLIPACPRYTERQGQPYDSLRLWRGIGTSSTIFVEGTAHRIEILMAKV